MRRAITFGALEIVARRSPWPTALLVALAVCLTVVRAGDEPRLDSRVLGGYALPGKVTPRRLAYAAPQVIATRPPQVAITSPAVGFTYDAGTSASVTLSGTAANISTCSWTNSLGGSGTAPTALSGATLTWSAGTVSLTVGANVVTVTCSNGAGGTVAQAMTVTRSSLAAGCSPATISAGSSSATINTAIGNAADGATLCFASGSYSMSANIVFSNSKSAKLICETEAACDVTLNGTEWGMPLTLSGAVTKSYRISGFDFVDSASYAIEFSVPDVTTGSLSNLRIDHNRFQNIAGGSFTIQFCRPDATNTCTIYGLIDHNEFQGAGSFSAFRYSGIETTAVASPFGTANNVFFEDNLAQATTHTSPGIGCLDTEAGSAVVYRFNTFINCMGASHGVPAGGGPSNTEYYGNLYQVTSVDTGQEQFQDCTWIFHHQGSSEITYWGNQCTPLSGHTTAALDVLHYRDGTGAFNPDGICDGTDTDPPDGNRSPEATYRGYPCWRQPGRDQSGVLRPMYSWMNTFTDNGAILPVSISNVGGSPNYYAEHLVANRDYYFAVSATANSGCPSTCTPFTGATGMGYGTLAQRPTSCTKTPEPTDEPNGGVGYFVWDDDANDGSWNSSSSNPRGVQFSGKDGLLYRCSATDTWSLHYTPYTYPHPFQGSL